VLQARGARATLERHPQQARDALDAIEHTNTQALSDMRRLLAVLRDTEDEPAEDQSHAPQPSLASLEALVDRVCAAGAPVRLEIVGDPGPVPPGVDLSAYRIVQEALTNVLKHAGGAHTTIRLRYGVDALGIEVVDDGGTGAHGDTRASANGRRVGHGLIGIRERVAVIGGEVSAGPRPEGGFEVNARLPYSLEVP
jgi:signal transduction histidine kinase